MVVPDWVHGTVMVVRTEMVVTGMSVGIGTPPAVVVTVGAQVMMAGLDPTCGAQIPWK